MCAQCRIVCADLAGNDCLVDEGREIESERTGARLSLYRTSRSRNIGRGVAWNGLYPHGADSRRRVREARVIAWWATWYLWCGFRNDPLSQNRRGGGVEDGEVDADGRGTSDVVRVEGVTKKKNTTVKFDALFCFSGVVFTGIGRARIQVPGLTRCGKKKTDTKKNRVR